MTNIWHGLPVPPGMLVPNFVPCSIMCCNSETLHGLAMPHGTTVQSALTRGLYKALSQFL